ncbi:MAG: hypothetical protein REI64_10320 [Pedobacter sp.]|uniref:hypothetical protein n=1 Tax=Pedobacter sp. TaxID=1411316 RepID=UPI002808F9E9|nr:hypothetical protein [Pedobacter sp.]MDQ8005183.1 hypothetical protein [Pedobacter sp.]
MKIKIIGFMLICVYANILKAQTDLNRDAAKAYAKGGGGAATNDKLYTKYIQLIDAETKTPIANRYVTFYKKVTALGAGKSDEKGYVKFGMRNSNYYNKVTIDINPNANDPQNPFRNKTVYIALNNGAIVFPSKKEVKDTIKIYVNKAK